MGGMEIWVEIFFVTAIAAMGAFLGRAVSGFRRHFWALVYFVALLLVTILLVTRYCNWLACIPVLARLTADRAKFVILSMVIAMGMTAPISQLRYKWEKIAVYILMVCFVTAFGIVPFVSPTLVRGRLTNLETNINSDGICLQSTPYTCAPAAAVTALKKLGLDARESEIAILARTSPVTGTLPWSLTRAIESRYRRQGLKCRYRAFDSIQQLKEAGVTLVALKETFLMEHCVAVLDISDEQVVIADPIEGKRIMTLSQFANLWRFSGIVLERDIAKSI